MKLQAYGVMVGIVAVAYITAYDVDGQPIEYSAAGHQITNTQIRHSSIHDLKPYQNKVVDIQEFADNNITYYMLELRLEKPHSIVTYAPSNFAQSQNNSIHRYLLPHTTLSQDFENEMVRVQQHGSHVEIFLFGQNPMYSADDYVIVFMIEPIV